MKFQKAVNVWDATPEEIAQLQPGQWVYAGDKESKGRFLGVKQSGSVVVAWRGLEMSAVKATITHGWIMCVP